MRIVLRGEHDIDGAADPEQHRDGLRDWAFIVDANQNAGLAVSDNDVSDSVGAFPFMTPGTRR
jgi:hypothetical protein